MRCKTGSTAKPVQRQPVTGSGSQLFFIIRTTQRLPLYTLVNPSTPTYYCQNSFLSVRYGTCAQYTHAHTRTRAHTRCTPPGKLKANQSLYSISSCRPNQHHHPTLRLKAGEEEAVVRRRQRGTPPDWFLWEQQPPSHRG